MGLQINQIAVRNLDPPTAVAETRATVQDGQDDRVRFGFRGPVDDENNTPFQRQEPQPDRVGFGRGSISVPVAAVRTIDRNLEAAEQIVPTLEETRERVRERLSEVQEQLESTRSEPVGIQGFDFSAGRVEAAGQARDFVNSLNESAGAAFARLQGETAPTPATRIDIRIGDETLPLLNQTESPAFEFFA